MFTFTPAAQRFMLPQILATKLGQVRLTKELAMAKTPQLKVEKKKMTQKKIVRDNRISHRREKRVYVIG